MRKLDNEWGFSRAEVGDREVEVPGLAGLAAAAPQAREIGFSRLRCSVSGSQWWRYSLSAKASLRLSQPEITENRQN